MGVDLMTYRVRVGRFSNRGTFQAKDDAVSTHLSANEDDAVSTHLSANEDDAVSTHLSANKAFICPKLRLATFAALQAFVAFVLFIWDRFVELQGSDVSLSPFAGFDMLIGFSAVLSLIILIKHAALPEFKFWVQLIPAIYYPGYYRRRMLRIDDIWPDKDTQLLIGGKELNPGPNTNQGYDRRKMHRLKLSDVMWPDKDDQLLIGGIERNPGPNTNQGYKVNLKDPDAELPLALLCVKCNLLLRKPRQTFCGHRLCSGCLKEHISGGPQTCVVHHCPDIISEDQVYPDRAVEREVLRVEVVCTNKGDGCPWEGKLKDYEAHEAECEFIRQPCGRSGCKDFVYKKDLEHHLKKDCLMRPVDCEYCKAKLIFKDVKDHHLSDCPEFPVECDQCHIDRIFTRSQLKNHQDLVFGDCPVKLAQCSFALFGCTRKLKPEEIGIHLKENLSEHVNLLFCKMEEVRRHQAEINAQHQNGECGELDSKLQALRETLTALERQIVRAEQDHGSRPTPGQSWEMNDVRAMDERERKFQRCEETNIDLFRKIEVLFQQIDFYERERQKNQELMQAATNKITMLERSLASKDDTLQLNDTRVENLERATYNGILVWKITDFVRRRQDAVNNRVPSFYSPPFYTSKNGYKMCARIYLNGDGMGKGTHVSLFFVICKGSNDALLRWPFRQKVTLMLLDQNNKEHIIDAFRPDPSSSSFKKPTNEMNIASGCPMFATLSQLDSPSHAYIKDDTVVFKIIVDCADLQ